MTTLSATPPLVLAFDCACSALSAAIARGPQILAHEFHAQAQGQAATLAPLVQKMLRAAKLEAADIELIGVTIGPGSFTGIRIGLAFARGLALALNCPLAGRTTFDAVSDALGREQRAELDREARRLLAAIDSKRDEIFVQNMGSADAAPAAPVVARPDAVVAGLPAGRFALVGDAAPALARAFLAAGRAGDCQVLASAPPDAAAFAPAIAAQGVSEWRARNQAEGMPRPLYLRAPDVSRPEAERAAAP